MISRKNRNRHVSKIEEKLKSFPAMVKRRSSKKAKKYVSPLIAPSRFSECYSWPSKIAYTLHFIKKGTPEEIASEIIELEGTASQEGVAEITITVTDFLQRLRKIGKIKSYSDGKGTINYELINSVY